MLVLYVIATAIVVYTIHNYFLSKEGSLLLKRIRLRLNTAHDKFKVHKILGITIGLHYLYMYGHFLLYGTLGILNYYYFAIIFVLVWHTLLPLSSFQFRVAEHRNPEYWLMIWKEYRLHTCIFTIRSVGTCALTLFLSDKTKQDTFTVNTIKFLFVMLCHYLADITTKYYGKSNVSTIRCNKNKHSTSGMDVREFMVKTFYSWSQFASITSMVHIHNNYYAGFDASFASLFSVHFAAFLMTLQKSGIIEWYGYTIGYSLALLGTLSVFYMNMNYIYWLFITIIFVLRVYGRVNKYILWFGFYGLCNLYFYVYS